MCFKDIHYVTEGSNSDAPSWAHCATSNQSSFPVSNSVEHGIAS